MQVIASKMEKKKKKKPMREKQEGKIKMETQNENLMKDF